MLNSEYILPALLPMRAFKHIPTPRPDAQRIVGLVKNSGKISGYQLENGSILSKDDGIRVAKEGGIIGVGVSSRKGNEYLKSLPNAFEGDNLSNLPIVNGMVNNNQQLPNQQFPA